MTSWTEWSPFRKENPRKHYFLKADTGDIQILDSRPEG